MAQSGAKAPQSFNDALGDVLMAVTNASLAPDADMDFIEKVRQVVLGKLKHMGQQPQPGAQPGAAGGGGAAPAGPPPSGGPQAPPPPQGGPQPHPNIPQMDPDEMRRVIAQNTGS